MRRPTEHQEQVAFVEWWGYQFPGVLLLAIPNGGWRSPATAGRLKAEGVRAGVPDLFVPAWNLWIEMKRSKGGHLSPAQVEMINYLRGVGHAVAVCHGFEEARSVALDHARRHDGRA